MGRQKLQPAERGAPIASYSKAGLEKFVTGKAIYLRSYLPRKLAIYLGRYLLREPARKLYQGKYL